MTMTKKELQERHDEDMNEIYNLRREIRDLTEEKNSLKFMKDDMARNLNMLQQDMELVVNVLSGEAKPKSKVEVLCDIFSCDIESVKKRKEWEQKKFGDESI